MDQAHWAVRFQQVDKGHCTAGAAAVVGSKAGDGRPDKVGVRDHSQGPGVHSTPGYNSSKPHIAGQSCQPHVGSHSKDCEQSDPGTDYWGTGDNRGLPAVWDPQVLAASSTPSTGMLPERGPLRLGLPVPQRFL